MKILFIINQLFQLMVVSQIKLRLFNDAERADILIAIDTSSGLEELYENLQKTDLWSNINIIDTGIKDKRLTKKISYNLAYMFDSSYKTLDKFDLDLSAKYDAIFINRFSYFSKLLCSKYFLNCSSKIYVFEEGYGSYIDDYVNTDNKVFAIRNLMENIIVSKIRKKPLLKDMISGRFYFRPDMVQYYVPSKKIQIPGFDLADNYFFQYVRRAYDLPKSNEFDKKFIFLEENELPVGIDDFQLIMRIAETVGKENILVKLHPRRVEDRFSKCGIKVSKMTGVPWEAILLKYNFQDKVIITFSSSAALSSRLYFGLKLQTYMLYDIYPTQVNSKFSEPRFRAYLDDFSKIYGDEKFNIPKSETEFLKSLKTCRN